ncbi:hypothetical protein [Roseobacter litoralis]|uniref:Uncharacterized protein n=1 Tax=Roseobacter litoralis (strain ATCC 49566 / DSM 6996 / JCM 21268 / NBRC 15278 / OCh 149) TaxID=391595 RepID=F7ZJN0_ROSLO|nr:hypothetical protein [Roseobacter litoralis]AEI93861.1 hypothetical protein RLO149_c018730 [Roseobacter litoralis Och 149]
MEDISLLTEKAITANRKLVAHRKDLESPFIHGYSEGCCELIAVHLGSVLQAANPDKEVQVVRAYNRQFGDWHYWVEMENLVLDLTAHQFEQYQRPLVCAKPNLLEDRFPDIERISTSDAVRNANFEMNPQIEDILAVLKS